MFTYFDALEYLGRKEKRKIKPGLERIDRIVKKLGDPQKDKKIIHIAGTKGKGSTSIFLTNLLMSHGFKVGLYTSPHLQSFRERISINKKFIESKYFGEMVEKIKEIYKNDDVFKEIGEPTMFEILTALSFKYFDDEKVDFIVLETGLGGRFDATNIISSPVVTVITKIDYDHMDILGNSLKEIAFEKAGIIKKERPLVLTKQEKEVFDVIIKRADELFSKVYIEGVDFNTKDIMQNNDKTTFTYESNKNLFRNLEIKLLGTFQVSNSSLSIKVMEILDELKLITLNEKKIRQGLINSFIAGRGEVIKKYDRTYILDGAHNVISMKELKNFIETYFSCGKINMIFGILNDKDIEGVLKVILPCVEKVILTAPEGAKERRTEPSILLEIIKKNFPHKEVIITKNIKESFIESNKFFNNEYPILVTGSFYVVGEFRNYLNIFYTY
ncbi:MAG: bifunctional folylpolyglutamate synthase/dihydrofolate synthase [Caldisericia bacterium]